VVKARVPAAARCRGGDAAGARRGDRTAWRRLSAYNRGAPNNRRSMVARGGGANKPLSCATMTPHERQRIHSPRDDRWTRDAGPSMSARVAQSPPQCGQAASPIRQMVVSDQDYRAIRSGRRGRRNAYDRRDLARAPRRRRGGERRADMARRRGESPAAQPIGRVAQDQEQVACATAVQVQVPVAGLVARAGQGRAQATLVVVPPSEWGGGLRRCQSGVRARSARGSSKGYYGTAAQPPVASTVSVSGRPSPNGKPGSR